MNFTSNNGMSTRISRLFAAAVFSVFLAASGVLAQELSEYHTLNIDPVMKKKIGQETLKTIEKFFESAERAIESENLDALMSLYSDNYKNESHNKKSARRIWARIFKTFDNMATIHNMRLETYSKNKVIIIGCSGLLLGKPADEQELITIDSWTNEDHVLSMEEGGWKLIGTTGKQRKRFWFDKAMHPLF